MGFGPRIVNFIYGAICLLLVVDLKFTEMIPYNYFPIVILILGVFIIMTNIVNRAADGRINDKYHWFRRWILGGLIVLLGAVNLTFFFNAIQSLTGDVLLRVFVLGGTGSIVLLLGVGIIYIAAAFEKIRKIQAVSR